MSTFDPRFEPPEPPGDWQMPQGQHPGMPDQAAGAAAVYVWLCAGVCLLMCCCCVLTAVGMNVIPQDEWAKQLPQDMPNRSDVLRNMKAIGVVFGVIGVLVFLLPAVVLALLGFKVRSGSRGAAIASMVVIGILTAALGLFAIVQFIGALITRAIDQFVMIIFLGCALALLIKTLLSLWASLRQSDEYDNALNNWPG